MNGWLATVPAIAGATVFASLAFAKAASFAQFTQAVRGYRLLPDLLARPVAVTVVAAEFLVGLGLVIAGTRDAAALVGLALLVLFMGAMTLALLLGRGAVDCGCLLRAGPTPIGTAALSRNAGLAALLILIRVIHTLGGGLSGAWLANAAAAGVASALLYFAVEILAALPALPRRRRDHERI